jgi:outer membrane protein assembly factor BamA
VDEGRFLLGFERALSWGGRYRWGLESHLWKEKHEPLLNAVGGHGQFWWLREDGSSIATVDLDVNSRYKRALITANTVRHFRTRFTFIPSLRVGAGENLPSQETFSLGGYGGFPGYKAFEVRGDNENATGLLLKYRLAGPLSAVLENVNGFIMETDSARANLQNLPVICPPVNAKCAESEKTRGVGVVGLRWGFEMETPLGPIRLDLGHNSLGRQQARFSIGSWR